MATGFDEHPSPAANDLTAVQQGGNPASPTPQDDQPNDDNSSKGLRVVS